MQLLGRQDIVGKTVQEMLPELVEQGFLDVLDRVYRTGEPFFGEEMQVNITRTPGGLPVEGFFNFIFQPIRQSAGNVDGIMVHAIDVTEQVHIRQAMQASQQRLELAQQAARIGTFEWDIPNNIIFWTPELEALYGLPPGGFEGKYENWARRVHPDDLEQAEANIQVAIQGGPAYNVEFRVLWPDGSLHWVVGKGDIYYDGKQEPQRMIGINMDITERKELEQRRDDFISMASHELRTPVTTIKANLQLAERRLKKQFEPLLQPSPETTKAVADLATMLERALRQVEVQSRLINDLMDASRIQADKLTLMLQQWNLVDIVRDVVEEQRLVTPSRTILFEASEQEPFLVLVDRDRIGQVIGNYIVNALKYSPEKEPVVVNLRQEGTEVCVEVRDHGTGLSEQAQQHIWERFYQVPGRESTRSSRIAGLGLGLHICQILVSRHGGSVGVESKEGEGSRFWFSLPLV
jgi:two-component system CheB/CheR fusion protein